MTARDQIKAFVARIERLDEEAAAISADKSEVYKEAKATGFDVPALKSVVAHRRRREKIGEQAMAEQEGIFATYLHTVEGSGLEIATRAGADEPAYPLPPHDAETGEIEDEPEPVNGGEQETAGYVEVKEHGSDFPDLPAFLDRRRVEHSLHQFRKPVRESDSGASRNHKAQSLEHQEHHVSVPSHVLEGAGIDCGLMPLARGSGGALEG